MTRINVVPVKELCDKHLLAEYRELPRVFKLARPCPDAPKEYTLGKGHVKFFYNKLLFIECRFMSLIAECKSRGFNIQHVDMPLGLPVFLVPNLWKHYTPTPEALAINRARIAQRIAEFKRPLVKEE